MGDLIILHLRGDVILGIKRWEIAWAASITGFVMTYLERQTARFNSVLGVSHLSLLVHRALWLGTAKVGRRYRSRVIHNQVVLLSLCQLHPFSLLQLLLQQYYFLLLSSQLCLVASDHLFQYFYLTCFFCDLLLCCRQLVLLELLKPLLLYPVLLTELLILLYQLANVLQSLL